MKNLTLITFSGLFFLMACSSHLDSSPDPVYLQKTDLGGAASLQIQIHKNEESIHIRSSDESLQDLQLYKDKNGCYSTAAKNDFDQIQLCMSEAVVTINSFSKKTLFIKKPEAAVLLESPRAYSMEELRERARSMSYESRKQFQNLVGAKANMQMHYLNLLPHLSMSSIAAAATAGGLWGLLSTVGDLVPFLLPSRWSMATASKHIYLAQQQSLKIMRDDAMQIVENLSYVVARDEQVYQQSLALHQVFIDLVTQVQNLEKSQKLATGRYRDISSPLNLLEELLTVLDQVRQADLAELSLAVGFQNPAAIQTVVMTSLPDINSFSVPNNLVLQEMTLKNSSELSQIDELIAAAKAEKESRFFDWLDPSGDPQGGLGFALPAHIQIASSAIAELKVQKEQIRAELLSHVNNRARDFNFLKTSYQQAIAGLKIQMDRIEVSRQELNNSPNDTPVGELQDSLQQVQVQISALLNAQYGWYGNLSVLNRLTHQGVYHD